MTNRFRSSSRMGPPAEQIADQAIRRSRRKKRAAFAATATVRATVPRFRARRSPPRLVPRLQFGRAVLRQVRPAALVALMVSTAGRAAFAAADAPSPAAMLFAERCSTCHNIGGGVKGGPHLLGVGRRRDKSWFRRFVRGPSAAIDAGDPIAAELYKKF